MVCVGVRGRECLWCVCVPLLCVTHSLSLASGNIKYLKDESLHMYVRVCLCVCLCERESVVSISCHFSVCGGDAGFFRILLFTVAGEEGLGCHGDTCITTTEGSEQDRFRHPSVRISTAASDAPLVE